MEAAPPDAAPDSLGPDATPGFGCVTHLDTLVVGQARTLGSTVGAGSVLRGACGGQGPEVVVRWTAPATGTVIFDTEGSNLDTVLYTLRPAEANADSCALRDTFGPCNDDLAEGNVTSELRVDVEALEDVYLVVDSYDHTPGEFVLNARFEDPGLTEGICDDGVDNDLDGRVDCEDTDCFDACPGLGECGTVELGSALGSAAYTGTTARGENFLGSACGGGEAPEQRLTWTAPFSAEFTFDTDGSSFDTVLYRLVRQSRDDCFAAFSPPGACNDDHSGGTVSSALTLELGAGEQVTLVVDGYGRERGDFVLNVSPGSMGAPEVCDNGFDDDLNGLVDCDDPGCETWPGCRPNPECPSRELGSQVGSFEDSTVDGTRLFRSACGGGQAPELSFEWRAPASGLYTIDTFGSGYDTVLSVYEGLQACSGGDVVALVCNDDTRGLQSQVEIMASRGQRYLIVADGWANNAGDLVLTIRSETLPGEELDCDDGADDDGDGRVDCDDADCDGDPACTPQVELSCDDGVDNDGDGFTDCSDGDCASSEACGPMAESNCADGTDNDSDGFIDCADLDCRNTAGCLPNAETSCSNGQDDDMDGVTDCADDDCDGDDACLPDTETSCNNGVDDDGDTAIDCEDDDCDGANACLPGTETHCSDGIDDDGDTAIDCEDDDCDGTSACLPDTEISCGNGVDDDGDMATDCEDDDCAMDPLCAPPPPCYQTDLGSVVGMQVARGSTVGAGNDATGSCGGNRAPDVLLRWTAPNAGTFQFNSFGSTYDTLIYVWRANDECSADQYAGVCNDDARRGLQSLVTVGLEAGETVYLVMDGWNTSQGNYNVNIEQINDQPGPLTETNCFNGLDDDGDGRSDCNDSDCSQDCTFP